MKHTYTHEYGKLELPCELEDVISKVNSEYSTSEEFVLEKRELFEERAKFYLNVKDQQNKIYVRLIFSVIDTLKALYSQDKPVVTFSGRQLGDDWLADNINAVAKFDYSEMGCEDKKDTLQHHRLFYGVGIEIFTGFNPLTNTPEYKIVNPLCRVPDIYQDINEGPRFHGFELQANKRDLTEENGFFNLEDIQCGENPDGLNYNKRTANAYQRELGQDIISDIVELYYHYTVFDGKKYLVVLANNKSLLVKFEEILPVTKLEKNDPSTIQFPVITRNYRKAEDDPYGICVPDLLEDKESMIQLFYNLNRIKAEHDAYGDTFMVDDEVVDVKQLQIPTLGPKYIKAKLRQNPNPITEVPRSTISQSSYDMPMILKQQATLDIGLDERSLGVSGDKNITATENQRIQKNANLKIVYGAKLDGIAEKKFWKYWYRLYQENLKAGAKKVFKLNNRLGSDFFELTKEKFISLESIDIQVLTESETQDQREKEKMGLMTSINYILQNPDVSKYSKTTALRQLALLNGTAPEMVDVYFPPSIEEIKAMQDVALLNNNEDPLPIEDLYEDHWTYIVIYQRAQDTDAKFRAISKRMEAIKESGSQQAMPTDMGGQGVQNQAMAQMMNQEASAPGQATALENK